MYLDNVVVHKRVNRHHPDVSDDDVAHAWHHIVRSLRRRDTDPTQYVAVGFDSHGRLLEMCAVRDLENDAMLVYHAMRATQKVLDELDLD